MAWGWGSACDLVSGSSGTSELVAWSRRWWGGARASCPGPTLACTSTPPCAVRSTPRTSTMTTTTISSTSKSTPPYAASRRPACSPQTDGGTEPSFPPVHCAGILSALQNQFFPTLTCGGSSPGRCSRSMRAWPSLLYNLKASFWPGMVILCTSWLNLIFGLSFTETSLNTQPSAGCLWQVTRWVPARVS